MLSAKVNKMRLNINIIWLKKYHNFILFNCLPCTSIGWAFHYYFRRNKFTTWFLAQFYIKGIIYPVVAITRIRKLWSTIMLQCTSQCETYKRIGWKYTKRFISLFTSINCSYYHIRNLFFRLFQCLCCWFMCWLLGNFAIVVTTRSAVV